ncbi:hypothetical protein BB561_006444 [Smittium simulii]|uniref:AAR2 splicing factor homolog n=1 Tax=Smittium simulii TaxID=133385 RepID=A0A2T9Y465_9FUNG|nr:hypothetical protein BB561_006444 [Smittium simulii]
MDNETANALYDKLGFLVILGLENSIDFGIDLNLWQTTPNFMGLKLIPPGLHLISYSSVDKTSQIGIKSCFFHVFEPGQLVVKDWDVETESIVDTKLSADEQTSLKLNIRDLDKKLGAYPSGSDNSFLRWQKLTRFITPDNLSYCMPKKTVISNGFNSATSSSYDEVEHIKASKKKFAQEIETLIPESNKATIIPDHKTFNYEAFNFNIIDLKSSFDPTIHSPFEISKYSMDKSYLLEKTLSNYKPGSVGLLGEMQLAFIILLIGQNFNGLEHYKMLVGLITGCEMLLSKTNLVLSLFIPFLDILQTQLLECPPDFFTNVLTMDNFLIQCLKNFAVNIDLAENTSDQMNTLKKSFNYLRSVFKKKFGVDLPTAQDIINEIENDPESEYAPTIV